MLFRRKVFKKSLISLLVTSLFVQSFSYVTLAAPSNNEPSYLPSAEEIALAQQDGKNLAEQMDLIEQGQLAKQPIQKFDIVRLANQRIEIIDGKQVQRFNLNDYQVEIPPVAYTGLNVLYNKETKELIFEATRGANAKGENGTVVARQIIPDMKLAGLVRDEEILSLVDHKGRLHAIDMGYGFEQLFKSPVPIFQNLWLPAKPMDLSASEVRIKYLTLGTKPFDEKQLSENTVLPRNAKNEIQFTAGDLSYEVIDKNTDKREVIGVFSRDVTYQRMAEGAQLMQWLALMVSPNNENIKYAERIINEIEKNKTLSEQADLADGLPVSFKATLRQIKPEQIESLMQAAIRLQGYTTTRRGQFTLEDWKKDYDAITDKMKKDNPDIDELTIEKFWHQGIEAKKVESPLYKTTKRQSTVSKVLSTATSKKGIKILAGVFAGLTTSYLALPYAYDYSTTVEQIKVISWLHENLYPPVLKDTVYRTPLLVSTVSLIAILPISVALSAVAGQAFKDMASKLQNSSTKSAQIIRDLAKNWGHLTNWQRITTAGMRLYAWLIYPYWRLMSTMLRQKTFFAALENGINPFTLINKDSGLGKKLGITQDTRVGTNNVFASNKNLAERSVINLNLQGAIAEQKNKMQNMAWALATLVVCEKNQIDPATLLMMSDDQLDLNREKMIEIYSDPKMKGDWNIISDRLITEFNKLSQNQADISKIDPQMFRDFYQKAQATAEKVKKLPQVLKTIQSLRVEFKKKSRQFLAGAIKIGKYDHEFLKKVYTNKYVSDHVEQSFSIDHIMVAGIVAFHGERADLSNPSQLAADPNGFLYTSTPHWVDMMQNFSIYFLKMGSSLALTSQKIKAKAAEGYAPKENYLWVSKDRAQGIVSGMADWTKEVFNPMKADLGGFLMKRLLTRISTFTAGLTLEVGLRTLLFAKKYGVPTAFLSAQGAWVYGFFMAEWAFAWLWTPIQVGNRLEGERLERHSALLKEAQYLLANGHYDEGQKKILELYFESNPRDLQALELTIFRQLTDENLKNDILRKNSLHVDMNSNEKYYFGLLSELAFAIQLQDVERIQKAENLLRQLIVRDNSLDVKTLVQLSGDSLLKFSISNTPIYTTPNKVLSWLTTWSGAIITTIMAIPFTVIMTTNELMMDPWFIAKGVAFSLGMYGVAYLTLSKKMAEKYIQFYRNNLVDQKISLFARFTSSMVKEKISSIQDSRYRKVKSNPNSCDRFF